MLDKQHMSPDTSDGLISPCGTHGKGHATQHITLAYIPRNTKTQRGQALIEFALYFLVIAIVLLFAAGFISHVAGWDITPDKTTDTPVPNSAPIRVNLPNYAVTIDTYTHKGLSDMSPISVGRTETAVIIIQPFTDIWLRGIWVRYNTDNVTCVLRANKTDPPTSYSLLTENSGEIWAKFVIGWHLDQGSEYRLYLTCESGRPDTLNNKITTGIYIETSKTPPPPTKTALETQPPPLKNSENGNQKSENETCINYIASLFFQ